MSMATTQDEQRPCHIKLIGCHSKVENGRARALACLSDPSPTCIGHLNHSNWTAANIQLAGYAFMISIQCKTGSLMGEQANHSDMLKILLSSNCSNVQ